MEKEVFNHAAHLSATFDRLLAILFIESEIDLMGHRLCLTEIVNPLHYFCTIINLLWEGYSTNILMLKVVHACL